ncbi:MAG: hypothetical protein K0Q55_2714 [Verrucomicrobia bacterium]|nr:hypothetical protein [Verrucomicrobiota bacterium]
MVTALIVSVFVACSDKGRLPNGWAANMDGVYIGKRGKLEEIVALQRDGAYSHVCKLDGTEVINESGTWTTKANPPEIILTPRGRGHFSKLYDPVSNTVLSQPEKLSFYTYWPLAEDGAVVAIFIGVQSELRLIRQK